MINWIEEAEKRQKQKERQVNKKKTDDKIIKQNHLKIHSFITELKNLVGRVSKISPEARQPSNEIGFTHLKGENKYEFYGSAYIYKKSSLAIIFISNRQYICWRRIHFKITDEINIVKVKVSEKCTPVKKHSSSKKMKFKYIFNIDELSANGGKENLAMVMLNWIAFKISCSELKKSLPDNLYNNESN